MHSSNHQLVRDFFAAIARGELPDSLVTPDMTFWSINSGQSDRERFHGGVKLLASIFDGTLTYVVESLTAEEDRVVAEVCSHGTLSNGEAFHNNHAFIFRLRNGQISSVAEFMNQFLVREKIVPLMQAAMARATDKT